MLNFKRFLIIIFSILIAVATMVSCAESLSTDTDSDSYYLKQGSRACGGLVITGYNGTLEYDIASDNDIIVLSTDTIEYQDSIFIPYLVDTRNSSTGSFKETIRIEDDIEKSEHEVKVRILTPFEKELHNYYEKALNNPLITYPVIASILFLLTHSAYKSLTNRRRRK